jgi:hypothetical protein
MSAACANRRRFDLVQNQPNPAELTTERTERTEDTEDDLFMIRCV